MPFGSDDHLSLADGFAKFGRARRDQRRKTPVKIVLTFDPSAEFGLRIPTGHRGDLFRTSAQGRFDFIMIKRDVK
jgi:hypothetical protein